MDIRPAPPDPLLTPEETAGLLGVAPGTLAVWRATRRYALKFVKVGRSVRYRRADVDAFIVARTVEPASVKAD